MYVTGFKLIRANVIQCKLHKQKLQFHTHKLGNTLPGCGTRIRTNDFNANYFGVTHFNF